MSEREESIFGPAASENQAEVVPMVESLRRRQRPRLFLIGEGGRHFLPTLKDLADPNLFLPLKVVLGSKTWSRSRKNLEEILPQVIAGAGMIIFGYRYRNKYKGQEKDYFKFYVRADQVQALRDLFAQQIPDVPRRRSRSQRIEILNGDLADLPSLSDLQDRSQFLSLKRTLGNATWGRYKQVLGETVPTIIADSPMVLLRYRRATGFSYFVLAEQVGEFKERVLAHLGVLEKAKGEYLKRRRQEEGTRLANIDKTIEKIRKEYPENCPIFYSSKEFCQLLNISRFTLSEILFLARQNNHIPESAGRGRERFYWRDEVISAFEFFDEFQEAGGQLYDETKKLRAEKRESNKLTLKEAAKRLGVATTVLQKSIVEGKIVLGDRIFVETVKGIGLNSSLSKKRLIQPELIENLDLRQLLIEDLDRLTLAKFRGNREHFSTLYDVIKLAGLYLKPNRFREVSKILEQAGIRVVRFPHSKARPERTYYALLARDLQKAAEIAKNYPDLAQFRQNPVELVCGPEIQLPTTWEVFHTPKYLSVGKFLRRFGVKVVGLSKVTIPAFFADDSPVSILKYRYQYVFPSKQEPIAREFVEKRKKQLQSSTQVQTG